jgi:ferrous iron transport protein B
MVALLGNPNTGKSTIFNRLTGLRQRIANYPGITIEAHKGELLHDGGSIEILDLPGTYSLSATSPDERVVIDVLTGHGGREKPDAVVCILDATNLKRNLFLASQLAEFEMPMVLVLNQWDVARKRGIVLDPKALEKELGVPVIPTVGTKGEGIAELRGAIADALEKPRLMRRIKWDGTLLAAAEKLQNEAALAGDALHLAEAHRLLFDCNSAIKQRLHVAPERLEKLIQEGREHIRTTGLNPGAAEAVLQYAHMDRLLENVLPHGENPASAGAHSIDTLLVHRVWGSLIFIGVMWVVFQAVYAWAAPLMDGIEALTGWAQKFAGAALEGTPVFQSLVADGVIAGVGGVIIFLPQIFILFLFIALLEDSGYMSRAAFLMDKLFGWCGLNGKSFVPLLSSFACAIPGIMAARSLEDPKARLTTVLMAPLMSCSARLPVYVLLIGAFVEPVYGTFAAGWTLFVMHFVGLAVALPLAWLLNRVILKTPPLPFILELSEYKLPDVRNVLLKMWEGGREFIIRAGTIIFAFSVIIWALLYFPRSESVEESVLADFVAVQQAATGASLEAIEAALDDPESELAVALDHSLESAFLETSYLGRFGKAVQPIFAPAGFDWKITVGVLASFPAREVIIATLGIIYNLGPEVDEESEGLRARMAAEQWTSGPLEGTPIFTIPVVLAIMVFFALCLQCGSTVAVMARQLNWSWAIGAFFGMTALAWAAAVIVYQVGTRIAL